MTPLLRVNSYEEMNAILHRACQVNMQRRTRGHTDRVYELWEDEKPCFLLFSLLIMSKMNYSSDPSH